MVRFRTLRHLSVIAVVAVTGTLAVPPTSASASFIITPTIVSSQSAADSTAQKAAHIACPSAMKVVGAGAEIGYTADQVHITGVLPIGQAPARR